MTTVPVPVRLLPCLLLLPVLLQAAPPAPAPVVPDDGPARQRQAAPQADGAAHTLRQIPEACTRLEGAFTGQTASPYRLQLRQTRPDCQPRARFVSAAQAAPGKATGWVLDERILVPSAACAGLQVELQVWKHRAAGAALARDGQGQGRVYLDQARQQASTGQLAALPAYSARLLVHGACATPR